MSVQSLGKLNENWNFEYSIAKAISGVFRSSGLSHGGILFAREDRVAKIGTERYNIPDSINAACDRMILRGHHPAFTVAKSRRMPFNMLKLGDPYLSDPLYCDFVEEALSHDFKAIFAFPLRDFTGRLFVASGLRPGRIMTEIELRLAHTFCLEALDNLDVPIVERRQDPSLLAPRERECLIAAGRGETEKNTARRLGISPNTVHAHLESCKRKLGVKNKVEAIVSAIRRGVLSADEI